ncbi:carbohydrate sulfotransferase 3-like isoform X1 [Centruroides sculpturatus]|uniref:carbohydrate sulfotransferase 3-like isoform X1 n=2 Tax=Centruroides sculpturatus TaxID=218467 RepID=UPI000C6E3B7E|nr:carbohydrate sulfotransferase 3-like isoform X1 [Centruroides sculpturatus]
MKFLKLIMVIFFTSLCLNIVPFLLEWHLNIGFDNKSTSLNMKTGIMRILQEKNLFTIFDKFISILNLLKMKLLIYKNEKNLIKNYKSISKLIRRNVKLLPVYEKENVTRILLFAYFRSGSTFLGDTLQRSRRTFYHFEPLHLISFNSRIDRNQTSDAFRLLSHLFRCNFNLTKRYNRWASLRKNRFLFKRNRFLWSTCRKYSRSCFNSRYLHNICIRSPVQIMKVLRLQLKDVLIFLQGNRDLNIKLIYLSRDPRAIMSSRKELHWCQRDKCNNPVVLCEEMKNDVEELRVANISYLWIRYEDLSLNTVNVSRNLLKRLSLPFSRLLESYLLSHVRSKLIDEKNPYSTRRNSSTVPYKWLKSLTFPEINNIQTKCFEAMNIFGYVIINKSAYFDYKKQNVQLKKKLLYPSIEGLPFRS